jgi:hypothetical protein
MSKSHQFALAHGDSYTVLYHFFLSLGNPLHPDLVPLMSYFDMLSKVCNPNDPTVKTLDLHNLYIHVLLSTNTLAL